jgi:hypothetical protein
MIKTAKDLQINIMGKHNWQSLPEESLLEVNI